MATSPRSGPVVVGFDGSDGSRAALPLATEEAQRRHAPLRLLHALSWPLGGTAAVVVPLTCDRGVAAADGTLR
jgi:nucleotide-binding universal stress UspA family protein